MHRYIPVLAKNAGFGKIGEKSGATPSPEIWGNLGWNVSLMDS
jgi:hypothetical protein